MEIEPEIALREIPAADRDRIEQVVLQRIDELEKFYDRIISCRVMVETQHQRHRKGNLFHVRIYLSLPGKEIAVSRAPPDHQPHEDVDLAIHDAFEAAERQLEDAARQIRGQVKSHDEPPRGIVTQVFAEQDHAFIRTLDGRDVYVHRNAVLDGEFDVLQPGIEVTYLEHDGFEGPHASSVRLVGRHRHPGLH